MDEIAERILKLDFSGVKAAARGREGRRAASREKSAQQKRDADLIQRREKSRARANRLHQLELEAKLLDATDIDSFERFIQKRRVRAAIKVQKRWRLHVAIRKKCNSVVVPMEVTPEIEAATRVIQRAMKHYVNRRRRRWRPATAKLSHARRLALDAQIRDHLHRPFREASWASNSDWLREESVRRFHDYRCKRSDEAFAACERSAMRKSIDATVVRMEMTTDFGKLTLEECEKQGLLKTSGKGYASGGLTGIMGQLHDQTSRLGVPTK